MAGNPDHLDTRPDDRRRRALKRFYHLAEKCKFVLERGLDDQFPELVSQCKEAWSWVLRWDQKVQKERNDAA